MGGSWGPVKRPAFLPSMDTLDEEDEALPLSPLPSSGINVLIEIDQDAHYETTPTVQQSDLPEVTRSHRGSSDSSASYTSLDPSAWFRGRVLTEAVVPSIWARPALSPEPERGSFTKFFKRFSYNTSPAPQRHSKSVYRRGSRSGFLERVNNQFQVTRIGSNWSKSRSTKNKQPKPKRKVKADDQVKRANSASVLEKERVKKEKTFWSLTKPSRVDAPQHSRSRIRKRAISLPQTTVQQLGGCTRYPRAGEIEDESDIPHKLRVNPVFDLITKVSMNSPDPAGIMVGPYEGLRKEKQREDAQTMYKSIVRDAERSKTQVPPYELLEYIGKGGSGRVYKCKHRVTGVLAAAKIINVDDIDYEGYTGDKDEVLKNFRAEVATLQMLKESNAKNINMIHEAFDLHKTLWIVTDWCTGGSIRTLMRANIPPSTGLEERFVIAIARELAIAVKGIHDAGIIHRDIKCTNVYITEEGDIQLGDYGITAEIEFANSKRNTIIGTPHFMPPNVWNSQNDAHAEGYGAEVDIWAYGCTVYEMATGSMPYMGTKPDDLILVNSVAPKLDNREHSQALCEFVAFCLELDPQERPSAAAVLNHPYIANTDEQYPTSSLTIIIDRFLLWEYRGGQRQSLWAAGGAAAPKDPDDEPDEDDAHDWNFNISDNYNVDFGKRYSHMIAVQDFASSDPQTAMGVPSADTNSVPPSRMQALEEQFREMSAARGEKSLERVFNTSAAPYELHTPISDPSPTPGGSDLQLRATTGDTNIRESFISIDLDSAGAADYQVPAFDFDHAATLRARLGRVEPVEDAEDEPFDYTDHDNERRATMEWSFPSKTPKTSGVESSSLTTTLPEKRATMAWTFQTAEPVDPDDTDVSIDVPSHSSEDLPPGFRPTLKHTVTEPIGQFRDNIHVGRQIMPRSSSPMRDSIASMIDLDMASPEAVTRPGTSHSMLSSTDTDKTSGNPFDLDDQAGPNGIDYNRLSYHKQWQSEGGQMKRLSHKSMQMHSRGNSLNDTDSDTFDSGLSRRSSIVDLPRMHPSARDPSIDTNQWPTFGPHTSLEDGLHDSHTLERMIGVPSQRYSRVRTHSHAHTGQPELEFPVPEPAHPQTMLEDADPGLLAAELDRMLADLDSGMRATCRALHRNTGVEHLDDGGGLLSGLDRSDMSTDEEGY